MLLPLATKLPRANWFGAFFGGLSKDFVTWTMPSAGFDKKPR